MKSFKKAACTFSLLAAASCGPGMEEQDFEPTEPKSEQEIGQVAQLLKKPNAVRDQYIVVFKENLLKEVAQVGTQGLAQEMALSKGGQVLHVYKHAVNGFAVRMSEAKMRELLADPRVAYIEEDGVRTANNTQTGATWGLDRIDQANLPLNQTYTYNVDGTGVHAYIIDTGVRLTHSQFTGRMGNGFDAVTSGGNANDCQGHGTHVAGTVGGTIHGVAKKVTIHPVRVLDCQGSGTDSGVIAGIDWVTANHVKPAVANMSLGGGASATLDAALARSHDAGVVHVVAAGNDNSNACNYSPAREPKAITVGSTTSTDARSSFSNFGTCIDIWAPGSSILSASSSSDTATTTLSGTSMASPHVAGAAALYLAVNPSATPQQVRDALVNNGTLNKVTNPGTGSINRLLYTSFITGTPQPGDTTAPTTSITAPTDGATLSGTATVSASASDNVGVAKVDFFFGTTLIGSDTTAPYSVSWNTGLVANGTYSLTAKASDAAGNVGTSAAVSVSVNNVVGNCSITEQVLLNPGFESGAVNWTTTTGVIDNSAETPARTGSYKAWLNGYGRTMTDSAYQQIAIPSTACSASLKLWLRITTAETTTTSAYDRLAVQVRNSANTVLGTLATYSNLNKSTDYVERTFDLSAYKGQTVRIYFNGTEDASLATSFFVDDTSLTITR
ncbi:MAG TPA: S8 family serine peptidase [Myxococcaceae bacterium]|jgi:subtilisin family serine protease